MRPGRRQAPPQRRTRAPTWRAIQNINGSKGMMSVWEWERVVCECWCVRVAKARKKRSEVACCLKPLLPAPWVCPHRVDVPCVAASQGQHCYQPSTRQTTWPTGTRMPCTSVRAVSPVSVGQRPTKSVGQESLRHAHVGRKSASESTGGAAIRTPFLRSAMDKGLNAGQTLKDNTTRS